MIILDIPTLLLWVVTDWLTEWQLHVIPITALKPKDKYQILELIRNGLRN